MFYMRINLQFSYSVVSDSATLWIAGHQDSLSITNSQSLLKTHVHQVSDAIQPSHPLSSPSPPAPNPSQYQGLFQWVNSSHEVAKVLEFQLKPYVNPLQGSPTSGPSTGAGPVRNGVRSRRWVAGDKKVGVHCRALDKFSRMKAKIIYMPKTP